MNIKYGCRNYKYYYIVYSNEVYTTQRYLRNVDKPLFLRIYFIVFISCNESDCKYTWTYLTNKAIKRVYYIQYTDYECNVFYLYL